MSDMTMVDTDKLKSTISKLDNTMNSIRANVKTAREALDGLNKGWNSEAKNEFFRIVSTDLEAMTEMEEQYAEIGRLLEEIVVEFNRSEEEALSSMKSSRR